MKALEFYDRALKGNRVEEREFDMHILPGKLTELIKKYEIAFNPEETVPQDLDMAKRAFDAAVELITEVGIFCNSTKTVIPIYEDEIREALSYAPTRHIIGEDADAAEVFHRSIDDSRRPKIIGGPMGAPLSEENYIDIMTSYALEPVVGLHTGAIQTIFGCPVRAGEPVELIACHYESLWTREAVRRAGKPGLCIEGIMSGVSSEAQDAGDFPGGLRPSDLHLISFSNELKVNWDDFKKIIHNQNSGNLIEACTVPMLGGYCGGPEGTAITAIAEALQGFVMAGPMSFASGITALRFGWSNRPTVWANCMIPLAFNCAGVDAIIALYIVGSAGPNTEMLCDELAAESIAQTVSGVSTIYGAVGGQAATLDYATGMETRIVYETSGAAAGMSREQANEIVNRIIDNYEDRLKSDKATLGQSFRKCYDKRLKPSPQYEKLWDKKKVEYQKMGLAFR